MIKGIIFDLDGTLLDTSRDICKTLNESLKTFGLSEVSLADTIKFVGNGARKLIERAAGDDCPYIGRVYSDYLVRFAACDNMLSSLYKGESDFLATAKRNGIKLAIVTNKPQDAADAVYSQFFGIFGFDSVIGGGKFALKPDPESTLYTIQKLGLEKHECLFVGDGETDIMTAANAGIECISVLWGFRTRDQLARAGAIEFAESYSELYNYVFKKS